MSGQEAAKFPCQICGSLLSTSKRLETHIRKMHQNVDVGESSTAPPPQPTAIQPPQKDSPPLPEQTVDEIYQEEEWMKTVAEEMDIIQEMEELTQHNEDNELTNEQTLKDELKEKMIRFKIIVEKKSNVVKALKEVKERLEYDIEMRKEVESNNAEEITKLQNENKEGKKIVISAISESKAKKDSVKEIVKEKAKLVKSLEELREAHAHIAKEKNNLEIELQTKDFMIKEKTNLLTKHGIQEDVEVVAEIEPSSNRMDKNSGPMCIACDRKFVSDHDLENHMNSKHEKNVKCPSCKNVFTRDALKKHTDKGKCTPKDVSYVCTVCKMLCIDEEDLKEHKKADHDDNRSKQVCRHYKKGNCRRGDSCPWAHVGHVTQENSNITHKSTTVRPCRNGIDCVWKARGRCHFQHEGVGKQTPRPAPQGPQRAPLAPRPAPRGLRPASQGPGPASQGLRPANQGPHRVPLNPRSTPQVLRPTPQQRQQQQSDPLRCLNGLNCINLAKGNCVFGGVYYHRAPSNMREQLEQEQMEQEELEQEQFAQQQQERLCWYNENCRRSACPFTHLSLTDFPNLSRSMRPQILKRNQNSVRLN